MTRLMIAALMMASLASTAQAAERRFALSGFDHVALAGSDNVQITHGAGFAVVATGADADLEKLDVRVEGGTLKIGRKTGWFSWGGKDVLVRVTMPALHGLALAGSGDAKADRGEGDRFEAKISGSGDMAVAALAANTVEIGVAGSGNVDMAGRCGALNVKLAGSGDARLARLSCTNASIKIAGSGDVAAHAAGQVAVSIAGSGDAVVTGGGHCTSKVAGSGTVKCS